MRIKTFIIAMVMPLALITNSTGQASGLPLLDLNSPNAASRFAPTSDQVTARRSGDSTASGVVVTIRSGEESYPGVHFKPEGGVWNMSQYGHIESRIVNTGAKMLDFGIRVDNATWTDSNAENYHVAPGESVAAKVIFGFSYRQPGFPLKTSQIQNIVLFAEKSDVDQSFRIESIQAAGPVGEQWDGTVAKAKQVPTKPKDGFILGGNVALDQARQIEAKGGAKADIAGQALKICFPEYKQRQWVNIKPAAGQWDLRGAIEVRVKVRNIGQTLANPKIKLISNGGATDEASLAAPLTPEKEGEIVASFVPATPWKGIENLIKTSWDGQPNTGTKFTSDTIDSINISTEGREGAQLFLVESIRVGVPAAAVLPSWTGTRPPVEGDWTKTFDEEFDGSSVDLSKWNIYTENFWDKKAHFSKDNVIVGGGVAKLRFEKKTGHHNDDPGQKQTGYATGFLDTYGKWVQRYGYFEARMKLPKSPGLWPAFWLMPDRGAPVGPQAIRQSTTDGGMEFDIMEFLSRWGQYRYNIAMHWDGYGADHHQTGSPCNYFMPDKDGFITAGLLWLPGLAVYYANGKEILRWETSRISNVESDIMFTAVSGGWDNDDLDDSKLPDDFVIDYVRVWQRSDLASTVDGPKVAAAIRTRN